MTTFDYIRKGFANKEWGGRIIHWIDYRYYFQTLDFGLMDDGRYYFDAIKADEELKDATLFEERLREVACGIVAEYIYNEHEKTPKQIFEDYYNDCFESYKGKKIHDIELMLKPDDEIELAFVKTMISDEKRRIETSKAINEFMTDDEKKTLAQVGSCFMEYLQNKLNKIKPKQEQPNTPTSSPSAKDDGNSYITNDKILKALPDLYDCLVCDGVISGLLKDKQGFTNTITSGNIPTLKKGASNWVLKIVKFKGFIHCIKQCFDNDWYNTICQSAGLTDKEMGGYNTENTADLEEVLKKALKQNGIG